MKKIPVYIVTGYLGAGKTSLINSWMHNRPEERLFIIENEIGKVNIDEQMVAGKDVDLIGLTAGCICCSLNDELLDVLEEVSARRDSFDRLVIETTGIADPSSIAAHFIENESVSKVFELRAVLTLVDAENIDFWLKEVKDSSRQISFADMVLINKIDLVSVEKLQEINLTVGKINPTAEIYAAVQGDFDVSSFIEQKAFSAELFSERLEVLPAYESVGIHGIKTFTLFFDGFLDLRSLIKDLALFLSVNLNNVFRIKAVVAVGDYNKRILLQTVRKSYSMSDGTEWNEGEPIRSSFVFIGSNLDKEAVDAMIKKHVVVNQIDVGL